MIDALRWVTWMLAAALGQGGAGQGADPPIDMESLIEQAMDEIVDFEITDEPLLEAFSTVGELSGVPLTIRADSLRLLPHGADTRLTARMQNVPLREGIAMLVRPLGMHCKVLGDRAEATPTEALLRIGRRATWNELATLDGLSKIDWSQRPDEVKQLRSKLQFRVEGQDAADRLIAAIARVGAGRGDEVLTLACQSLDWTWYPWGKDIAVTTRVEQTYRELQRPITLRVERKPLADVFLTLARLSRIKIAIESGALAALPREARDDFSLLVEGVSFEQVLEVIAGATGLAFEVEGDGVAVYLPQPVESSPTSPKSAANDPIVGRVTMPGQDGDFQYEFFIRRSDLPPDIDRRRIELIDRVIETLRRTPSSQQEAP
jgi:hypothetical protein